MRPEVISMSDIKRLVLDVLKPHKPSMLEMSQRLSDLDSVSGVNATMYEVDEEVENIKLTVRGEQLDYDSISSLIEDMGGSIHSVDEAVCGDMVEESTTPQDAGLGLN
jgi:hypothetical protein